MEAAVTADESRKHILTEKPMAISLKGADDMIAAAQKNNVCLMVGQVLRFRGANIKAKQLIKEGKIGEPLNMIRRRFGN